MSCPNFPTMGSMHFSTPDPSLNQSLVLKRGKMERRATEATLGILGSLGTLGSAGSNNTILRTRFTEMVFEPVPSLHNVLASVFMWTLLAGFLILPTTFPDIEIAEGPEKIGKMLQIARDVPLLVVGFAGCSCGGIGLCLLWLRWRHNYDWLLSSIFIPGMFSGISVLISTLVSLYGSQDDVYYGTTTIATLAATGGCAVICGFLTAVYSILKASRQSSL